MKCFVYKEYREQPTGSERHIVHNFQNTKIVLTVDKTANCFIRLIIEYAWKFREHTQHWLSIVIPASMSIGVIIGCPLSSRWWTAMCLDWLGWVEKSVHRSHINQKHSTSRCSRESAICQLWFCQATGLPETRGQVGVLLSSAGNVCRHRRPFLCSLVHSAPIAHIHSRDCSPLSALSTVTVSHF